MVGQIKWGQQRRIESLVLVVAQRVELAFVLRTEVHVDETLVCLRHAILQSGRHAQLVALHRQDQ